MNRRALLKLCGLAPLAPKALATPADPFAVMAAAMEEAAARLRLQLINACNEIYAERRNWLALRPTEQAELLDNLSRPWD